MFAQQIALTQPRDSAHCHPMSQRRRNGFYATFGEHGFRRGTLCGMPHDLEALVDATGWHNPARRLTLLAEPLDLTRLGRDLDADRAAQGAGRKPKGLWYATGAGWIEKVYCDQWNIGHWLYELTIDPSRILRVPDLDAATNLSAALGVGLGRIDWRALQRLYAGVEVKVVPKDSDIDLDAPPPWSWLQGWDVTSGCLWDLTALRAVRLLRGPEGIVTVRTRTRR